MPNDCWNTMTVTGSKEEIELFFNEECKNLRDTVFTLYVRGVEGIQFKLWSAWHPDFNWLESLIIKYPSIWVKNIWHEEGGYAGVWIGSVEKGIQRFDWDDMCIEEEYHRFRPVK